LVACIAQLVVDVQMLKCMEQQSSFHILQWWTIAWCLALRSLW